MSVQDECFYNRVKEIEVVAGVPRERSKQLNVKFKKIINVIFVACKIETTH